MKNYLRMAVWVIMLIGGSFVSLFLDRKWFPRLYHNVIFHSICLVFGLLLLKMVMTISKNTGRTLAKYGRRGEIPRMQTNRLVTEGVYRYMRHPMHLGLLFSPFAVAFLIGSPTFILFTAPLEVVFMLFMIKWVEEPEAFRKFGAAYDEYKRKTPWFCFKKECLKALFQKVEKR